MSMESPSGYGLHWESLDVDLDVPQLGRQGGRPRKTDNSQVGQQPFGNSNVTFTIQRVK